MAEKWDITDHDDIPHAIARLQAIPTKVGSWSKGTLERASKRGNYEMFSLAPSGKHFQFPADSKANPLEKDPSLKSRIQFQQAKRGTAVYKPGGSGGGGTWEVAMGPVPLVKYGAEPTHDPAYILLHGSGIWGRKKSPIKAKRGGALTWMINAETQVFAKETEGQEPNRRWFDRGKFVAGQSIRASLQHLKL